MQRYKYKTDSPNVMAKISSTILDHGVGSTDHSAAEEPIRNQTIYIDKYKGA